MGIIKKPYELSIWKDEPSITGNSIIEKKVATIGSHNMRSPYKAINLVLKRGTNGQNTLTFSLVASFHDTVNGKYIDNPFVDLVTSETKLKLKYDGQWFDFIVKKVDEDSQKKVYNYNATDLHINELSKNGIQVEINAATKNNVGDIKTLGQIILKDTDWTIDENSDVSVETTKESLVALITTSTIRAFQILDPIEKPNQKSSGASTAQNMVSIPQNSLVYGFYSCCKGKPRRFQFIYTTDDFVLNNEKIIINPNIQYYMDLPSTDYTNNALYEDYGFEVPRYFMFPGASDIELIPSEFRAKKYIYGQKSMYSEVLQRSVWQVQDTNNPNLELWEDVEVEFPDPQLLTNYGGNNDFSRTVGWSAACLYEGTSFPANDTNLYYEYKGKCEAAANSLTYSNLLSNGSEKMTVAIPYLKYTKSDKGDVNNIKQCLIGTGVYDNRFGIKQLKKGEKYVVLIRDFEGPSNNTDQPKIEVANYPYEVKKGVYLKKGKIYLTFNSWQTKTISVVQNGTAKNQTYYYSIAEVMEEDDTPKDFQNQKTAFFLYPNGTSKEINLVDFMFFKYVDGGSGVPMTPLDQEATVKAKYVYNYYTSEALKVTKIEDLKTHAISNDIPHPNYIPVFSDKAEKQRTIEVANSNYFNALQTLAETFQVWVKFNIDRNNDGSIRSKKILFKNVYGKDNYIGFRYGINLKNVKRNIDSSNIVTKMIVKNNSNKSAENGVCSIVRATSNETGENYILDFSYYINQGLIDGQWLADILYGKAAEAKGADIGRSGWNCYNYFNRLRQINAKLDYWNDELITIQKSLIEYDTQLSAARRIKESSATEMKAKEEYFEQLAEIPFPYNGGFTTEQQASLLKNQSIVNILTEWSRARTLYQTNADLEESITASNGLYEIYQNKEKELLENIEKYTEYKKQLNLCFSKTFSRYICEGTWQDEKYLDHEKYYIDAKATMFNSCFPKLSYTIEVAEISQIPEYQDYEYELGDRTYIEDPEFFGYSKPGVPYREEIVLTEMTDNLDDPSKNTIKVQNYKTQFQDLFQKITATVQSVKYQEGSYKKATDLVEGEQNIKKAFIEEAFSDANTVLQNSGAQSVTWGAEGITITDTVRPSQILRMVGGAILFHDDDGWKTGITAKGISADLLTAGKINTGEILIANGDQISFRWDTFGLNAYDFNLDTSDNSDYTTYTQKGVRFDRFGIYGYDCITSSVFDTSKITKVEELVSQEEVRFALTWDGLILKSEPTKDNYEYQVNLTTKKAISNANINLYKFFSVSKTNLNSQESEDLFYFGEQGLVIKGKIDANDGIIAGWEVTRNGLSDPGKNLLLNSVPQNYNINGISYENIILKAGDNFFIDTSGTLYGLNSEIGKWTINENFIMSQDKSFMLYGGQQNDGSVTGGLYQMPSMVNLNSEKEEDSKTTVRFGITEFDRSMREETLSILTQKENPFVNVNYTDIRLIIKTEIDKILTSEYWPSATEDKSFTLSQIKYYGSFESEQYTVICRTPLYVHKGLGSFSNNNRTYQLNINNIVTAGFGYQSSEGDEYFDWTPREFTGQKQGQARIVHVSNKNLASNWITVNYSQAIRQRYMNNYVTKSYWTGITYLIENTGQLKFTFNNSLNPTNYSADYYLELKVAQTSTYFVHEIHNNITINAEKVIEDIIKVGTPIPPNKDTSASNNNYICATGFTYGGISLNQGRVTEEKIKEGIKCYLSFQQALTSFKFGIGQDGTAIFSGMSAEKIILSVGGEIGYLQKNLEGALVYNKCPSVDLCNINFSTGSVRSVEVWNGCIRTASNLTQVGKMENYYIPLYKYDSTTETYVVERLYSAQFLNGQTSGIPFLKTYVQVDANLKEI